MKLVQLVRHGNAFTKGSYRVLANHLQSLPAGEKDAGNLEAGASVNLEKFYDYDIGVKGPGFIQTEVNYATWRIHLPIRTMPLYPEAI